MNAAQTKTKNTAARRYLMSLLIGLCITAAMLAGVSMLFSAGKIGYDSAGEAVIVVNFVGATLTGIMAVDRKGGGAMKAGLISGGAYMIILLLLGLIFCKGSVSGSEAVRIIICSVCGGAFGGALCLKRGNKKLHKKIRQIKR